MSQTKPTDVEATKYAESFVIHGCKTRAFKTAFPNSKASPDAMNVSASRFHNQPKVLLRIEELHEQINAQTDSDALYSAQMALKELDDARQLARDNKQVGAMVSSIMGKAKIAGLLTDKVKHVGAKPVEVIIEEIIEPSPELKKLKDT